MNEDLRYNAWRNSAIKEAHKKNYGRKKCKKVLMIDATDYPLVRVVKPFSPVDVSGDDPLTNLDEELRMYLWSFHEFEEVDTRAVRSDILFSDLAAITRKKWGLL